MQVQQKVRSVMIERVICVSPANTIDSAYRLMRLHGFRHLPVTDDDRVVGVLSDRDILLRARDSMGKIVVPALPVDFVMTTDPYTCLAEAPLVDIAYTFVQQKIDCMPVVDAYGRLIGIVTSSDILQLFSKGKTLRPADAKARSGAVYQ